MNYIAQIKGFWMLHEKHSFNPTEITLYFYLLEVCNAANWVNPFKRNSVRIMADLKIARSTFFRARRRLLDAKIIDFNTQRGVANTTYRMTDLEAIYRDRNKAVTATPGTGADTPCETPFGTTAFSFFAHTENYNLLKQQYNLDDKGIAAHFSTFYRSKIDLGDLNNKTLADTARNFYYWLPKHLLAKWKEKNCAKKERGSPVALPLRGVAVAMKQLTQLPALIEHRQRVAALRPVDDGWKILKQAMVRSLPKKDVFNTVLISVARAFADMNVKEISEADRDYLVNELTDNIMKYYPSIRLSEIPDAIALGIRGRYGQFFGLSVVSFEGFISAYLTSEKRTGMVKGLPADDDEPKSPPTPEAQFATAKYNTLQALHRKTAQKDLEVIASSVYNFLDRLGLIQFSTDEKYDMLADAVRSLIKDLEFKLTLARISERPAIKSDIADLRRSITARVPLNDRLICLAKLRAKTLALDAFLADIIISESNLEEMIESKRAVFLKG
eukprot:gene19683-20147_t